MLWLVIDELGVDVREGIYSRAGSFKRVLTAWIHVSNAFCVWSVLASFTTATVLTAACTYRNELAHLGVYCIGVFIPSSPCVIPSLGSRGLARFFWDQYQQ